MLPCARSSRARSPTRSTPADPAGSVAVRSHPDRQFPDRHFGAPPARRIPEWRFSMSPFGRPPFRSLSPFSPPMSAKKKDAQRYTEVRNAKALRDFSVDERFEAGIQLKGTEVKSVRGGRAQINDAFGRLEKGELWLHNAHIEEYAFGNIHNHAAKRTRKLLLHRHQVRKIAQAMQTEGKSLIPLRKYFKHSLL